MSAPSPVPNFSLPKNFSFTERAKAYLNPYYLTVAGTLGVLTVVFTVVIVLLMVVAANCNLLGWVE
jgi:hypothetical protein